MENKISTEEAALRLDKMRQVRQVTSCGLMEANTALVSSNYDVSEAIKLVSKHRPGRLINIKNYYSKDFPQDSHLENGNYTNTCCLCKGEFIGYKRRVVCQECTNENNLNGHTFKFKVDILFEGFEWTCLEFKLLLRTSTPSIFEIIERVSGRLSQLCTIVSYNLLSYELVTNENDKIKLQF